MTPLIIWLLCVGSCAVGLLLGLILQLPKLRRFARTVEFQQANITHLEERHEHSRRGLNRYKRENDVANREVEHLKGELSNIHRQLVAADEQILELRGQLPKRGTNGRFAKKPRLVK